MNDLLVQGPNAPMYPMSDIEQMATVMAKSRMFGFRSVEEAMSLMLMAQAEGMHPAKAAQRYHVIQGRPALKAEAMLAGFQAAGGRIKVDEKSDTRVAVWFSHPIACPEPVLIDWTMERAKKAGLTGKDTWNKYPRQMLFARVISEGVRTCYPGVLNGMYTPEEVVEFDDDDKTSLVRKGSLEELVQAREPEVLSATVVGDDVQHITKAEMIAKDIKGVSVASDVKKFNGKGRGNSFELIAKIAGSTTPQAAKSAVTKSYNKFAYNKAERIEIDNALSIHCRNLEEIAT